MTEYISQRLVLQEAFYTPPVKIQFKGAGQIGLILKDVQPMQWINIPARIGYTYEKLNVPHPFKLEVIDYHYNINPAGMYLVVKITELPGGKPYQKIDEYVSPVQIGNMATDIRSLPYTSYKVSQAMGGPQEDSLFYREPTIKDVEIHTERFIAQQEYIEKMKDITPTSITLGKQDVMSKEQAAEILAEILPIQSEHTAEQIYDKLLNEGYDIKKLDDIQKNNPWLYPIIAIGIAILILLGGK